MVRGNYAVKNLVQMEFCLCLEGCFGWSGCPNEYRPGGQILFLILDPVSFMVGPPYAISFNAIF